MYIAFQGFAQGRIQKLKMVGKSMWRRANLIEFQRNLIRLALLHIRLPTPKSEPVMSALCHAALLQLITLYTLLMYLNSCNTHFCTDLNSRILNSLTPD